MAVSGLPCIGFDINGWNNRTAQHEVESWNCHYKTVPINMGFEYNADAIISISCRTMKIISHIKFTPVTSLSILAFVPNRLITPVLVSPPPTP